MKANEIKTAITKGQKVVKDIDGCCGIVSNGNWLEDIRKSQFAKLIADTTLNVHYLVGSVYAVEISR